MITLNVITLYATKDNYDKKALRKVPITHEYFKALFLTIFPHYITNKSNTFDHVKQIGLLVKEKRNYKNIVTLKLCIKRNILRLAVYFGTKQTIQLASFNPRKGTTTEVTK